MRTKSTINNGKNCSSFRPLSRGKRDKRETFTCVWPCNRQIRDSNITLKERINLQCCVICNIYQPFIIIHFKATICNFCKWRQFKITLKQSTALIQPIPYFKKWGPVSYLKRSSPIVSSRLLWRSSWNKHRLKSWKEGSGRSQTKKTDIQWHVPQLHLSAIHPDRSFCPCCEPADQTLQWCWMSLLHLRTGSVTCTQGNSYEKNATWNFNIMQTHWWCFPLSAFST